MDFKTLGDWCKWLEKNFSPDIMIPKLPVIIRLDGNNFHNWTKGLDCPFDQGLVDLMTDTTRHLVEETNAVIGYTQSDEITLALYSDSTKSAIYHEGKKQKILSKLTGVCSNYFNQQRPKFLPAHNKIANFDCRIYQTPTLGDACNQLLWRENDATRNSISMLAQSLFSHKELQKQNVDQMQDMMMTKDVNWNDLSPRLKRGTYLRRITTTRQFSPEELSKLPPQHKARRSPDIIVERNITEIIELPILNKITNRVDVIFNGAEPILL